MKTKENLHLKGLTKNEVLEKLGDEFNFYPDRKWVYTLKKYWWGKKQNLVLEFNDEDKVISQHIISTYAK